MSLNGVLVTPIEQNRSLLNSVFKFKPSSKLYYFVTSKGGVNKTLFTLAEVKSSFRMYTLILITLYLDFNNFKRCHSRGRSL